MSRLRLVVIPTCDRLDFQYYLLLLDQSFPNSVDL
jgi:hypothetical protein